MRAAFPPEHPGRSRRVAWFAVVAAAAFLAWLWWLTSAAPLRSEDWTQLAEARAQPGWLAAFDLAREPLRPLQHAWLWALANCGLDPAGEALPALARACAFALHALACAAVYGLARAAGLGQARSAAALLAFALFPNVKLLAWPASIGGVGRIACELGALWLFVQHLDRDGPQRPGWVRGAAALALFVLALAFHESAMLLPAIVLAWAGCVHAKGWRDGVLRAFTALRDPWLAAAIATAAAHALHLALFRPQRHHGLKSFDALPANVVKAALSLAPEWLREIGVEGLRGHRGALGTAAAGVVLSLVAAAWLWAMRRGGLARFAALAIALDLGLAVLGAGFAQRYAGFASACAALALASFARTRGRAVAAAILAAFWAHDASQDAREWRRAGATTLAIASDARAARTAAGAGVPIAILDLPDMAGAEEDVPWFNWGAAELLEAHGAHGPWLLWRTRPFRTSTDVELVDPDRVARTLAHGGAVLVFSGSGLRALAGDPAGR